MRMGMPVRGKVLLVLLWVLTELLLQHLLLLL